MAPRRDGERTTTTNDARLAASDRITLPADSAQAHRWPAAAVEHRGLDVARMRVLSILAGGAAGALARGGVGEALPHHAGSWPWATFIVNLAGAYILAWSTTRLAERVAPTRYWRLLLGTGFCGALTTFSTFQVETLRLARDGYPEVAVAYSVASLALGMVCAIGGTVVARRGRYG
jgi:CrcB protein